MCIRNDIIPLDESIEKLYKNELNNNELQSETNYFKNKQKTKKNWKMFLLRL